MLFWVEGGTGCIPGRLGLLSPGGPEQRGAGLSAQRSPPGWAGGGGAGEGAETTAPSQRASSVPCPRGEKAEREVQARVLPVPAV